MPKRSFLDRIRRRVLRQSLAHETRNGAYFMTTRARPKRSDAMALCAESSPRYSTQPQLRPQATGIVMQGPIREEDAFTVETLRLYRRLMPDCRLILSTWDDTPSALLQPVEDLGVETVLNAKPERPGPSNLNMQIASASGGMQRARDLGVEWVLKTRTDHRIHHPTFMSGLIALARQFPPLGAARETQTCRVFGLAQGNLKFVPYHLCDQTVFGHIDDMVGYWSPPLHDGELPAHFPKERDRIYRETTLGDFRYAAAESYLGSQFLLSQGRPLDWSVADGWAAYRDHFGVLDIWSLDIYWAKAHAETQRDGHGGYDRLTNAQELNFLEWLQIVSGELSPENAAPYESILAERITVYDSGYP